MPADSLSVFIFLNLGSASIILHNKCILHYLSNCTKLYKQLYNMADIKSNYNKVSKQYHKNFPFFGFCMKSIFCLVISTLNAI